MKSRSNVRNLVAPLVGAWIEIITIKVNDHIIESLPSWERGLKLSSHLFRYLWYYVAPLVGAWIEIQVLCFNITVMRVATLVGAWIEIKTHYKKINK